MDRYHYMHRAAKEELEQWSNVVARWCKGSSRS
jgi:hypothetical protein